MIPVIVIRPQPGCDATVAAARAMGLAAEAWPLFTVRPLAWDAPPPESFDALLIGSANALRHGGAALARYAGKPTYCVGETTAEAARAAGLVVVATGKGGLQPVLAQLAPAHQRLLRLAGRERIALALPEGVTMAERTVYASEAQAMPPALAALLASPALVMLHSAEAVRHFAAECDRLGLARGSIALACIGHRVVTAAGTGWQVVAAAARPDDAALLALAQDMCQSPDNSYEGQWQA